MDRTYKVVKVAKIIDPYTVVINAGRDTYTSPLPSVDDVWEIYSEGQEILDPETKESLGTLDFVKARIRVITVLPMMSICKNADIVTKTINLSGVLETSSRERLNVDNEQISGGFENVDKKVRIGDLVRKSY